MWIIILLLIIVVNLFIPASFVAMFWGAPYVPSGMEKVRTMVELAKIHHGDKSADLGSGDGRVVIAMAQAGAEAHGYDNNPLLVFWARRNIRKAGLGGKAFIHWGNFWNVDFSPYSTISVYGIPYMMNQLQEKITREMKPGSRIIANAFNFKKWKEEEKKNGVYLYKLV